MKYKKIENDGYNLHMIQSDKFKTTYFKLSMKEKTNKKYITYRNMLVNILPSATIKYPSRRTLEIASEDLYNVGYSMGNCISGNYNIMELRGSYLDEKYTEKGMNKKSLAFLFDILLKPLVRAGEFDEKNYELSYNKLKNDIISFKDNPKKYATLRLSTLMDKKSPLSYNGYGYLEDLEKLNPKKLYAYYKKVLKTNIIDIFIVGNIDFDETRQIVEKLFKVNNKSEKSESHFINYDKFRGRVQKRVEPSKFNQSTLLLGFKIDKASAYERQYVANIFSFIFGGSSDSRLFKVVREENSLCYSVYSSISSVTSSMIVFTGIDGKNYKKAVKLIIREFEKMKSGEISDDDIKTAKLAYTNSLKELEDNPSSIINMYVAKEYIGYDLLEERFDKVESVTKMDIINYINKIHLDTIYMLEGGNNSEENTSL